MKFSIIVPYCVYFFSSVNFEDLNDINSYSIKNYYYKGSFTVKNKKIDDISAYQYSRIMKINRPKSGSDYFNYYFLQFDFNAINIDSGSWNLEGLSQKQMTQIKKDLLISSMGEEVKKYLLILVLKTNNSISFLKGISTAGTDNNNITEKILVDFWPDPYKDILINDINMGKAWAFISKESMFVNGVSKTNVARAIAFFSLMVFENNSEIAKLVLTLTALEALYARGISGIGDQLADKIAIYLGSNFANRKMINKLYNTRSRYIHGDIDVSLSFIDKDLDRKSETELLEVLDFGFAVLIETIKKSISEEREVLDFCYQLN